MRAIAFLKRFKSKIHYRRYIASRKGTVLTEAQERVITKSLPFTMTSRERIAALIKAIKYLECRSIQGAIVECGVWKGGSMLSAALTLRQEGNTTRNLYLFDTFEGMTAPTEVDVDCNNVQAETLLALQKGDEGSKIWAIAGLEEVKECMALSGYPFKNIHYIVGDVLQTLSEHAPERIALLRLDTDWYESTKHELDVLYPRLQRGGVLIIDDYGHWQGAKKAVDEYFSAHGEATVLHKIDYTGRIAFKM